MSSIHEVLNQAAPLTDVNLLQLNLPLQEALAWHHPAYDRARYDALGAEAGSAEMQVHAWRLARDIAVLLQAALLQRSHPAVFAAFCESRLDGVADVFGLLPAGTDFDAILRRAMPIFH